MEYLKNREKIKFDDQVKKINSSLKYINQNRGGRGNYETHALL